MRYIKTPTDRLLVLLALVAAGLAPAARADVTIEEHSTFDFTVIKAHGTSVEMTTADKQRRSTDLHCEGFLSVFCRDVQSAEITRLDRDVSWVLEPKKKQYSEARFPTLAERRAAEQRAQEMLEKVKQCPTPATPTPTPTPDTSGCEMTPAKFDVRQTDQRASFAGHDAQLTQLAMTQSCQNKETGDTCDFVMSLDSWLTQDQIPGLDDRKAFQSAYLHKLGLDDSNSLVQTQLRQFMAPYAKSLKALAAKSGDFKGYPLKTAFRVSFGGERCAAAKGAGQSGVSAGNPVGSAGQAAGEAAASSAAGVAGAEAGTAASKAAGNSVGGSIVGSAASAFGNKLVGGLFAKKKTDAAAKVTSPSAGGGTPNMVQAAEFTVETTSVTPGPIAPAQFEIPAGWKLMTPEARTAKEFSCPKSAP